MAGASAVTSPGARTTSDIASSANHDCSGVMYGSSGELAPGQRFVNHDGARRSGCVVLVEQTAAPEPDPHRLAIARRHRIAEYVVPVPVFELSAIHTVLIAAQRQLAGECRGGDAWDAAHRFQGLREEPAPGAIVGVSVTVVLHLHGQQVWSIESGSYREQTFEAAEQQSSAHQQDDGEGHLRVAR